MRKCCSLIVGGYFGEETTEEERIWWNAQLSGSQKSRSAERVDWVGSFYLMRIFNGQMLKWMSFWFPRTTEIRFKLNSESIKYLTLINSFILCQYLGTGRTATLAFRQLFAWPVQFRSIRMAVNKPQSVVEGGVALLFAYAYQVIESGYGIRKSSWWSSSSSVPRKQSFIIYPLTGMYGTSFAVSPIHPQRRLFSAWSTIL